MKHSVTACRTISTLCVAAGIFTAIISAGSNGTDELIMAGIMLFIGTIFAAVAEANENCDNE